MLALLLCARSARSLSLDSEGAREVLWMFWKQRCPSCGTQARHPREVEADPAVRKMMEDMSRQIRAIHRGNGQEGILTDPDLDKTYRCVRCRHEFSRYEAKSWERHMAVLGEKVALEEYAKLQAELRTGNDDEET